MAHSPSWVAANATPPLVVVWRPAVVERSQKANDAFVCSAHKMCSYGVMLCSSVVNTQAFAL